MCATPQNGKGMTCQDLPPPPKCVAEGDECTDEEKCCGDLTCVGGKGKEGDCDLAIAFDSEECKKKTCRDIPPLKCDDEEGNECTPGRLGSKFNIDPI